ncbi:MAG: pilus assembly protein PilP [Mariprofundales bacterium]
MLYRITILTLIITTMALLPLQSAVAKKSDDSSSSSAVGAEAVGSTVISGAMSAEDAEKALAEELRARAAANQSAAPEALSEEDQEVMPDAWKHMVKAPDQDLNKVRDPFASYLSLVEKREEEIRKQKLAERIALLQNRPREPLEKFDLTTLTVSAIMIMGVDRVAMIIDASGVGYTVRKGNYLGKNSGRIVSISDEIIRLSEKILNPAGDLIDHIVLLKLGE